MNYWLTQSIDDLSGVERKTTAAKHHILHFMHQHGEVTPKLLQSEMGLSFPTASRYLTELTDEAYVISTKGKSIAGGPRPSTFKLKPKSHFCLGFDIGHTFLNITLVDTSYKFKVIETLPALKLNDRESWIKEVEALSKAFLNKHLPNSKDKVIGVGLSLPDIVNSQKGSFKNEDGVAQQLQDILDLPVFIENDTNVRLMSALHFGALKSYNHACYLQVDWGIGSAVSINGKLYAGSQGYAGEIGTLDMTAIGAENAKNTLENLAGGQALVRKVIAAIHKDPSCTLAEYFKDIKDADLTPSMVINAVKDGNKQALEILNESSKYLAKAISFIIHFLNPQIILIGGAIAEAGEYLLTNMQQSLLELCTPTLRKDCEIKLAKENKDEGALGATLLVLERVSSAS